MIHKDITDRYLSMIDEEHESSYQTQEYTTFSHLKWMLNEIASGEMDDGKANRWLGFVQGVLVMRNLTTVDEERNFTRPYFRIVKEDAKL